MNDLQLFTGFAILVSGYLQLHCGLSLYHWQIVVYLAFFSNLTHLSTLTFLRHYLYLRQVKRLWRLTAMFFFAVMLVVALIPTGHLDLDEVYSYPFDDISLRSNAACYFRILDSNQRSYDSMVISILTIVFGFTTRIIKLHKNLSEWLSGRIRKPLSNEYQKILKHIYEWEEHKTCEYSNKETLAGLVWIFLASLARTMAYRPALSIFLVLRASLDIYASTILEVSGRKPE